MFKVLKLVVIVMVVVTVTLGAVALGENVWIRVEGLKSFIGFGKRKGGLGLKVFFGL